jgi:hypothetical protein
LVGAGGFGAAPSPGAIARMNWQKATRRCLKETTRVVLRRWPNSLIASMNWALIPHYDQILIQK